MKCICGDCWEQCDPECLACNLDDLPPMFDKAGLAIILPDDYDFELEHELGTLLDEFVNQSISRDASDIFACSD